MQSLLLMQWPMQPPVRSHTKWRVHALLAHLPRHRQ
jgi:hypothetical protein